MSEGYLLGVDIGTYSSKGALVKPNGEIIATCTVPHDIDMPCPGCVEHDADKVWWHDFVVIVKTLLKRSNINPGQIKGVGTSGIGSCVLPIDARGHPLRPAILYGIDTRATKEIEYLEGVLGQDKISQWSGSRLTSQASGPKVLWIRNNEPKIYKKTRWFLTSQGYLVYKLTGTASIDVYTAGGYAPLYDVFRREWVTEAANIVVPIERLPSVYWSYEVVGEVTAKAAEESGLAEGTPVVAGTTDAAAEALSVGVSDIGDMMLMLGSSVFFIIRTPELIRTRYFWSSNFLEKDSPVLLGGMSTGGSLTTWFRDQFGQLEIKNEKEGGKNAYELLAKLASRSPSGSKGLVMLPYFQGERTPLHDPYAKGVLFGLTLKHSKGDIYRAILEGVAFGIRHNLEVMLEEGIKLRHVILAGGGVKNLLWTQIIADICNIKLSIPEQRIGASYGDAFLAGVGIGLFNSIYDAKRWVRTEECITPTRDKAKNYEVSYRIFRELYKNTKSLMRRTAHSPDG